MPKSNDLSFGTVLTLLNELSVMTTDTRNSTRANDSNCGSRLAAQLASERPEHTLQPTALVHEAYLRLFGRQNPEPWNSRVARGVPKVAESTTEPSR